jgi:hypothetical protein
MKTRLLLLSALLCLTTITAQKTIHKKSILKSLEETREELEAVDLDNVEELSKISCELMKMLEIVKTITIRKTQKTLTEVDKTIDFSLWGQLVDENNKQQQQDSEEYPDEDTQEEQE